MRVLAFRKRLTKYNYERSGIYARRNLFERMYHNSGRIGGTGNTVGVTEKSWQFPQMADSRNVICLIFVRCVQRSWTTLAGVSPVTVIASEPCS